MKEPEIAPPEYGRVADVQRLFGLKRTHIYTLLREGKIKGVCVQRTGNRGIRLFNLASIREYISQFVGVKSNTGLHE